MRRIVLLACTLGVLLLAATPGAHGSTRSWASPQISAVVAAGLMAQSVETFRPQDPLTAGELAVVLASITTAEVSSDDLDRPVTVRELNARLVTAAGLRPEARLIRQEALLAGLAPTPWLGTETVARLLGLRINHPRERESLELQLAQPATRAEAAYSIVRLLALRESELEAVRGLAATFTAPTLTEVQAAVLTRALKLVGSPYVWAGTSERPQILGGKVQPGGFDCSGFVWRVYKLQSHSAASAVGSALRGRTSYAMSGEIAPSARVARVALEPGDVVFFGSRGVRSKPSEIGHMGIYVGNGWIVHSSRFGTTLQPMVGWYETTFAWGRNLFRETGYAKQARSHVSTVARSTTS
ncbi:MAG TPA: NlpC/P60 family protein [Gaiellaceae bacterium]|nr:NlpC/P60 family protein [Gaiellaceae bacterium]